jgi:hypothetical protein
MTATMTDMSPTTAVNGYASAVATHVSTYAPAEYPAGKLAAHAAVEPGWVRRAGLGALLVVVAILLAIVITSPIALSSGELVRWAGSLDGLGLNGWWPWLVFIALDAAAFACVLLAVYCAFRGKSPGVFGILVWVFAGFSAFANYRHGSVPDAPDDAWWFFPVMSILGPGLLEAVTHFVRRQVKEDDGSRARELPKFGLARWLPFIGAPKDTFGARRTAQILGLSTVAEAVATYHALCPDGSLKVVRAIRARDVKAAAQAEKDAAKAAAREQAAQRPAAARAAARGITAPGRQAGGRVVQPTERRSPLQTWEELKRLQAEHPDVSPDATGFWAKQLGISSSRLRTIRREISPSSN